MVDAREHEVGLGADRPEGAGDDREGGGGVEPVGLHALGPLDEGPLVGDGRVVGHRADGGAGAAVVGARRHHDDLVRRVAARTVGPGHQRPRQRRQPRGAHPVVVGDENPHGALTLPPAVPGARAGPSPVRVACHPGVTARPSRAPHPRRGPGLLQFTRHAAPTRPGSPSPRPPGSSGASGTAARKSSSARWAPPCGPTPSARRPSSTASGPTSGPTRAGARSSPPGPTAWPTAATSSTGCGPRPPWTSPSAATPSTAWCAGCPGRSRPGTRTSSRSGCSSIPRPGYPFSLLLELEYHVGRDGLTVTTRAQSLEEGPIPFGIGFHPYLTAGPETVDGAILHVPARHTLDMDDRGLPTGALTPVEGTDRDFTTARFVGPAVLDTAYTTLRPRRRRLARASSMRPAACGGAALWVDAGFPYLMVYTGDTLGEVQRRRRAVAIEPMTCPPNALRTGTDVIALAARTGVDGPLGDRAPVSAAERERRRPSTGRSSPSRVPPAASAPPRRGPSPPRAPPSSSTRRARSRRARPSPRRCPTRSTCRATSRTRTSRPPGGGRAGALGPPRHAREQRGDHRGDPAPRPRRRPPSTCGGASSRSTSSGPGP